MSIAEAEYRKARCVELRLQGHSYEAIAKDVGYANRGTAHRTVTKALVERVDEAVDEYRHIELARLDSLQSALWDQAIGGDIAATGAILRIIDRRIRLLGLASEGANAAAPHTFVLDSNNTSTSPR